MKPINYEKLGGRAFLLTIVTFFITSIMKWFGHLDDPTYGLILTGTVVAFNAKSSVDLHTTSRAEVQKDIATKQASAAPPTTVDQVGQ